MTAPIRLMVFDGYNGFGVAQPLARPLIRNFIRDGAFQPIDVPALAPYINEAKILLARALERPMQPLDGVWREADGRMLVEWQKSIGLTRGTGMLAGEAWSRLLNLAPGSVETTRPDKGGRAWDPPSVTPESLTKTPPAAEEEPKDNTMLYLGLGAVALIGALALSRRGGGSGKRRSKRKGRK